MRRARGGFTVWDLLMVIALVGTLLSLLVAWLLWSQERARQAVCINNLRQLCLGAINHEEAVKQFPTNGWGSNWLADPDRGADFRQPGGWLFNLEPYIESDMTCYRRQAGTAYGTPARQDAAKATCRDVWGCFYCPSRRAAAPYPYTCKPTANDGKTSFYTTGLFCDARGNSLVAVGKNDYAGNGGQHYFSADTLPGDKMCDSTGPVGAACPPAENPYVLFDTALKDNTPIDDGTGRWKLTPQQGIEKFAEAADGVFWPFSQLTKADLTDGDSCTYLCGEKFVPTDHYTDGRDDGDNQCAVMGHDENIVRWTENERTSQLAAPLRDCLAAKAGPGANSLFGSPHPTGCNMGFCDGSVRTISFAIDPAVHASLANRKDGALNPLKMLTP